MEISVWEKGGNCKQRRVGRSNEMELKWDK